MRASSFDEVVKFLVSVGFKFDGIGQEYVDMSRGDDYLEVHNWAVVRGYVDGLYCKCDEEWGGILEFLKKKFE
jgi:hypothetical protein